MYFFSVTEIERTLKKKKTKQGKNTRKRNRTKHNLP